MVRSASARPLLAGLSLAVALMACSDDGAGAGGCEIGFEASGHSFVALHSGDTATAVYGTQGALMIVLTLRSDAFPTDVALRIRSTVDLRDGRPVMDASHRRRATLDDHGVAHIDELPVVLERVGPRYEHDPDRLIRLGVVVDTPSGPVERTIDFKVEVDGRPYLAHPSSPD